MVKIALAGGSGDVASEILDVLLATKKHEVLILSRSAKPKRAVPSGATLITVDYSDTEQLAHALNGVHTVLSFVSEMEDPTSPIQKRLIDAAVKAGVKRFAPSEWASSSLEYLDWYGYKGATREYLKEINKDKKVLEYTLFQPGLFSNYLTYPYPSTAHLHLMETPFDLVSRRFLTLTTDSAHPINFLTVQDLARVVTAAIEYPGEWPVTGGIRGTQITLNELVRLAEKVRGASMEVTKLEKGDLLKGEWKAGWAPRLDHPSLTEEQVNAMSKHIAGRILLAADAGEYEVGSEWNEALGGWEGEGLEGFLVEAWKGKD